MKSVKELEAKWKELRDYNRKLGLISRETQVLMLIASTLIVIAALLKEKK